MLTRSLRSYSSASGPLKVTSRDSTGNLTSLSVIVNGGGSKAGKSGLSHLLSKFNFLNTEAKSALRFTRESELLGGQFSSTVTRDNLLLNVKFLKEDLPYYVEALGNVMTKTSFRPHEFDEVVLPSSLAEHDIAMTSNTFKGLESLHEMSFRKGLGSSLYFDGSYKYTVDDIKAFADEIYNSSNVSIVASGANEADLNNFIKESAFADLPTGSPSQVPVNFFTGKESRIKAPGQSIAFLGLPIKPADFGKFEVLSATLGSSIVPSSTALLSSIPGATSQVLKYNEGGLFVVSVSGDAASVSEGIKQAKKIVESVPQKELSKSIKSAQLSLALQSTYESPLDIAINADSAKAIKLSGLNYVAVGDVDALPYADEL